MFSPIFIRRVGFAKFLTRLAKRQFTKHVLNRGIDVADRRAFS